jgi:Uma2 family endonuclease
MRTQVYLTPADHGRPLTLEEFLNADAQEGYRYEIIDGRLEVSPIPDLPHEDLAEWIVEKLRAYAEKHGDVINRVKAPARVFVPQAAEDEATAPEPDAACYRNYPVDAPLSQRDWRKVSPVLVVEVLSNDTADKDLERNRPLYLKVSSICEYWILDPRKSPDTPTLLVYRRRGQRWGRRITIAPGEEYTTSLLPGFRLVVDPHC